jgi:hypothetical protein
MVSFAYEGIKMISKWSLDAVAARMGYSKL